MKISEKAEFASLKSRILVIVTLVVISNGGKVTFPNPFSIL